MQITLHQFEQIDGLFSACLNRPALEQCVKHGREAANRMYFRPEWMLEDACVAAMGLEFVQAFPSAVDAAADVLTKAMLSASFVGEA